MNASPADACALGAINVVSATGITLAMSSFDFTARHNYRRAWRLDIKGGKQFTIVT